MRLVDLQEAEWSHSVTLFRSQSVVACKRYTVNEVVAEFDVSDFEGSEDDFDGYLDMDVYTPSPK